MVTPAYHPHDNGLSRGVGTRESNERAKRRIATPSGIIPALATVINRFPPLTCEDLLFYLFEGAQNVRFALRHGALDFVYPLAEFRHLCLEVV